MNSAAKAGTTHKSLLIAGLGIIVFFTYWSFIRPANIRSECALKVQKNASDATKKGKNYTLDFANAVYGLCLGTKGLKPEKIAQ